MGNCFQQEEIALNEADSAKVEREKKKEEELHDILIQYGRAVRTYQEEQTKLAHERHEEFKMEVLPSGAKNIILVLGQMLLPDGSPHERLLKRLEGTANLIKEKNLAFDNTYIIVSGGDVSNQKYSWDNKYDELYINKPHATESQVMKKILNSQYGIPNDNIICEPEARTTIENGYYFLKLLFEYGFYFGNQISEENKKKDKYHINNVFVVSSNWHIGRFKSIFNVLYSSEREVTAYVENESKNKDEDETGQHMHRSPEIMFVTRKYEIRRWFLCDNIEYVGIKTDVNEEKLFKKEAKLLKSKFFKPQTKEYRDYLWKWQEEMQRKQDKNDDSGASIARSDTMSVFAKATAIEHMYLKLNNARDGLVKISEANDFWESASDTDDEGYYVKHKIKTEY